MLIMVVIFVAEWWVYMESLYYPKKMSGKEYGKPLIILNIYSIRMNTMYYS